MDTELEKVVDPTHGAVKDKKAYAKWRAMNNLSILRQTMAKASDERNINYAWLQHVFEKKIEGLPLEERTELLVRKKKYYSTLNKANVQKRVAFGVKNGVTISGRNSKLLDVKQEEIIELFGRMFSVKEVHRVIAEDWHIPCAIDLVFEYRREYLNVITEKIEIHKREYSDIRLGVKRSRLEELVWLYNETKEQFKITKSKFHADIMIKLLEQVRKEAEGDKLTIDGNFDVNIESTVNVHLQQEVFKEINLAQLILGRVAARSGIDPMDLVASLQSSYYSKFNNILGHETEDADYEEVEYPSASAYDFDNIARVNKKREHNEGVEKAAKKKDKAEAQEEAAESGLKERLLATIGKKIGDNKARAANVDDAILKQEIEEHNSNNNKGKFDIHKR